MNISTQEVGHVFAVSALRGSSSPHSFGPGLGRSYFQVEYSQHDGWQCNSVAIFHYHRVVHVSSGEGRFNGGDDLPPHPVIIQYLYCTEYGVLVVSCT